MDHDFVIRIGKHKGKTVKWVMVNDRSYFEWAKTNAPGVFKPYKSQGKFKPTLLDTNLGGSPKYGEVPEKSDETVDSWTNPNVFYLIAQRMLRERGED